MTAIAIICAATVCVITALICLEILERVGTIETLLRRQEPPCPGAAGQGGAGA